MIRWKHAPDLTYGRIESSSLFRRKNYRSITMKKSTKKQLLARILTAVMGFSLIGCAAESSPANAGAEETGTGITKEETAVEQPVEETDGDAEIRALISSMTTEEKLAQMMIVALRSDAANTNTATELDQDYGSAAEI